MCLRVACSPGLGAYAEECGGVFLVDWFFGLFWGIFFGKQNN